MKKQLVVLQFIALQLIALIVFIILVSTPLFAEVIRNGGDNGNLDEVDRPGDVVIIYNDGLARTVSSNVVETIILIPVDATSTTQVIQGEDNKTTVEVPPDTFATTTYISIIDPINTPQLFKEYTEGLKIELAEAGNPTYKKIDSTLRIFSAYDEQGTVTGDFNEQVIITIPYPDANQDGIVDGTMISETSLKMYVLKDSSWVEVPRAIIDIDANIFTAPVWHFSVYGLRGIPFGKNLSEVYVYPNPFKPAIHNKITFAKVTDTATIRIFTIVGELVKTIEVTPADSGSPTWNGKNESQERVASGIYIYLITTEEGYKITGKIGIIK
ncbi:MAG: T9SS type A sorting domain-containing protein [bacterium]|nr:T9SS type A sorting domain-containing protein [bacterium]